MEVSQRGEAWRAETADIGPAGCLVVSLRPLVPRAPLWITLHGDIVPETLAVSGNVAWSDASCGGVEFVSHRTGASGDPAAWFRKLLKALPELAAEIGRVPDRVALDAALFVRPPPPEPPRLSGDEIALLRRTESGLRVEALIRRSELPTDRATRALFGLLAKRILTFAHGEAGEAWRWRALLARGVSRPPAAAPHSLPTIVRASPLPPLGAAAESGPPQLARAAPAAAPAPAPAARTAPARPHASGWARPAQAQLLLDEARGAARAGRIHDQAIPLLRRALAFSPGDAEIARLLGELAFSGR